MSSAIDPTLLANPADIQYVYDHYWNMQFAGGDEAIKQRDSGHAVWTLIRAEIAVCRAFISEEKPDFEIAVRAIGDARKRVEALYKLCRSAMKSYQASLPRVTEITIIDNADLTKIASSSSSSSSSSSPSLTSFGDDDVLSLDSSPDVNQNIDDDDNSSTTSSTSNSNLSFSGDTTNWSSLSTDVQNRIVNGLHCKLMQGEIAMWLSMIHFKFLRYVKGMVDFRVAWNRFSEAMALRDALRQSPNPTAIGASYFPNFDFISASIDFGMGAFHFSLSVVPRAFQWLIEGVGFKGDRQLALKELESSASHTDNYRAPMSSLLLSWIYAFFFFESRPAAKIIDTLLTKYPSSTAFHYTAGYLARKQGRIDLAEESFKIAYDASSEFPPLQLKIKYEMGYNCSLQLRWNDAIPLLEEYITTSKGDSFRAYCAYQIGLAYLMIGNAAKAKDYFKKLQPWVRKNHAYDEYAERRAKQYLKKGSVTECYKHYFCAFMLYEACNYSGAVEYLEKMQPLIEFVDEKVSHAALAGLCLAHLKDYDRAKEFYQTAISYEKRVTDEVHAVPWSYCGMAEICVIVGELDQAEQYIRTAKTYKNYDFESFLNWRVRKAEDDILKARNNEATSK